MRFFFKLLIISSLLFSFNNAYADLIKGTFKLENYNLYYGEGTPIYEPYEPIKDCKLIFEDNVVSICCGKVLVSMLIIDVSTEHLEQSIWPTYTAIDVKTGKQVKFKYQLRPGEGLELQCWFKIEYGSTYELYIGKM